MSKENSINLTDLIAIETIQELQDTFSIATHMAAIATAADGTPITKGTNFTSYCFDYTRCSELGRCMCEECDRFGAEESMRTGHCVTYTCHSGLIDFSAPITVGDTLVGCFVGGQVLIEPPIEEEVRERARLYGIDEDEYWNAIKKVPILSKEQVDNAADFLYRFSHVLSSLAYSKVAVYEANKETARAAKLQGDFLANMSHEIRTPMNAVIGFAEMALREDLPTQAKGYIEQIKTSGTALLAIINDILDYSKIESGKMDIIPAEYEALSLIDDIANIIMTRLTEKNVELLLDVDPNIPQVLYGDNNRIRQILINLCNNATKFTNEGYVKVSATFEWVDYANILIHFSIKDTGIGIKPDDLEKIFTSFQQVDSTRNRNIEGTGLGLTICRNLLNLMDSELHVESEYGHGSEFYFDIKQRVVDPTPSIIVNDTASLYVASAFANLDVAEDFINDASKLGVDVRVMKDDEHREMEILDWANNVKEGQELFFFVEQDRFDPAFHRFVDKSLNIKTVIIAETFADIRNWENYSNVLVLRKPVSVLNLGTLFNHKNIIYRADSDNSDLYNFTAPEAKILIVDDNNVNLTVAQGLLEPCHMMIDVATSGNEAIRMCKITKYHLVLMDHMMPEMDGIEATHVIRRDIPDYIHIPILALTANAVSGARDMFKAEGLDDFIPKPIEVRTLLDMVRRYLPQELLYKGDSYREYSTIEDEDNKLVIADLDTESAISMLGSEKLFMSILKVYYESIESKANSIRNHYEAHDWKQYAIEVHALKSSSRQIGAMDLGELAYSLEMAGKNEDIYLIEQDTDRLLNQLLAYKEKLEPFCTKEESKEENNDKPLASKESLKKLFGRMRVAIDDLDMDEMESVIGEMEKFSYSQLTQKEFDALKLAVSEMDVEKCIIILDTWQ